MRLAFLILTLLLGACAEAPSVPAAAGDAARQPPAYLDLANYRLGPGDALRIDVFGEPDYSIDAAVDNSGNVNYPLLGRITAAGLTPREVEQALTRQLANGYLVNPKVRVTITQFRPVFVYGQVQHSGSFAFIQGLTVEKAIALAGGLTPIGSVDKLYVQREGSLHREKAGLNTTIFPGDTVFVEQSLF